MIILETNPLCSLHLVPTDTLQRGIFTERHRMQHSSPRGHYVQPYLQPVGLYDNLLLQVHSNAVGCRVFVVDESGRYVKQKTFTGAQTVPGNTAPDYTGAPIQLKTHYGFLRFSDLALPEGIYTIYMEFGAGTPTGGGLSPYDPIYPEVSYLVSEPIWVRKRWTGSVLATYRNRINEHGFIWEQTGAATTAQFRVPGSFIDSDLELDAERYDEGGNDPLLLSSDAATIYQLQTAPLPLWARQKLNAIAGCSDVSYDSRRMVVTSKAEQGEGSFRKSLTLTLQTQHQAAEYVSGNGGIVIPAGTMLPYLLAGMRINTVNTALPASVLVQSSDDVNAAVDVLNGQLSTLGLNGRFAKNTNGVAYTPDGIEALKQIDGAVLADFIEVIGDPYSGTATVSAAANGYFVAVQNTKTSTAYSLSPLNGTVATGTVTASAAYPAPPLGSMGSFYARVFTGPATTALSITAAKATGIGTNSRAGLITSFSGTFAALTAFNAAALYGAVPTMQSIVLSAPNLGSVTGLNTSWRALKTVDFSGARLTSAAVDSILIDMAAYVTTTGASNGTIRLQGQTPINAPPTAASAAARTKLQNAGWTLTTD